MESIPANHTSRESAGSAPALSIHRTPVAPPLPFPPSRQAPLPAVRTPPPPPSSAVLAARSICASPPLSPTPPLRHRRDSARTASAVATETGIRRLIFPPPAATPARAKVSPLQDALCSFPTPSSRSPESHRFSFSNPCPRPPPAPQPPRDPTPPVPDPHSRL